MSGEILISRFESDRNTSPRVMAVTWTELVTLLSAPRRCTCTVVTCAGKKCREKAGNVWSPAAYPAGTTRSNENVGTLGLFVVDADKLTEDQLKNLQPRLASYRCIVHASHSDQPGQRCVRVVLPLSEPVLAADWPRFWHAAMAELGFTPGQDADKAAKDVSRIYYLPSRPIDADYLFATNDGVDLDVRKILANAPKITDVEAPAAAVGSFGPIAPNVLEYAKRELHNRGPAIQYDGGDQHTFSVCAMLLHDYALTDAEAWPLLREWNNSCVPPWDLDELKTKMSNALAYASGPFGASRLDAEGSEILAATLLFPSDEFLLEEARKDVKNAIGVGRKTDVKLLFEPGLTLLRREYPETPWQLFELLTRGAVGIIGGEPKTSKTWVATEIAMAISTGTKAFGNFPTYLGEQIAYFFAEDLGRSVQSHVRALAVGRGMDPEVAVANMHLQPRGRFIDILQDEDVALVVASCRRIMRDTGKPLGLLILEPLRDIHSGKENEADDMGPVMRRLRVISELLGGCTTLACHHMKKPSRESKGGRGGQQLRGSGATFAAIDIGIFLSDLRGDRIQTFTNTVEAVAKGARSAPTFDLTLSIVDDPITLTARSAKWSTSRDQDRKAITVQSKDELDDLAVLAYLRKLRAGGSDAPCKTSLLDAIPGVVQRGVKASLGRLVLSKGLVLGRAHDRHGKELKGDRYKLVEAAAAALTLADVLTGDL